VARRKSTDLLELEDVERRMKPFARHYLGVRTIPIDHVVGTEDRASSFTRDFRPRHDFSRDRLRSLAGAFPEGGFPPIVAVKLGETYFVIDGHHRVALTRRNGGKMIDADVTELVARVPLPPGADMVEVVLRELERVFIEQSGLAEARPGVRVSASRPSLYLELLENLQVHGYHLMRERERVLDNTEIAADWYDTIYRPVVETAERTWSNGDLPGADVFLLLHQRRREAFPSCGCPPLAETVPAEPPRKRRRLFGR
jgi:ParB/Sulfiredoxin domain